jgi:hypothetical protein
LSGTKIQSAAAKHSEKLSQEVKKQNVDVANTKLSKQKIKHYKMIERMINMSTKKEYTIEELEEQYKLAEEKQKALKQQIDQKKKEEEELREAELAKEKESRKKELDEALEKYKTLLRAYMRDYGMYSYSFDDGVFDLFSSKFWNYIT